MRRRIAILHHARSFFPLTLHQELSEAVDIVWVVAGDAGVDQASRLLRRLGNVVDVGGLDLDEAARALGALHPDGIVAFVDDHLVLAAELASRLGLIYHSPDVAATLSDKRRQRRVLRAAGVPGPEFWSLPTGRSPAEIRRLGVGIDYPAVLKPAAGSGSRGILAIANREELVAAYRPDVKQYVEEHMLDDPSQDSRFASYLSVESVVGRGLTCHVAITGRFALAPPFRETGNFIPAAIDAGLAGSILELTTAAIEALQITTGVLHTEIKLTPDGPKIIELNGRLGGRPPFVLQSVSDVNLFRAACDLALGERVHLPQLVTCRGVGYWRMLQPPVDAVSLRGVRGIEEVLREPHVDSAVLIRHPGERVDWREGTDGCVVTVRGRVGDLDALAAAIAGIDRMIELDYDRSPRSVGSLTSA
jgi:predicted ATP-grasp superfamily ATP-dependent carboligase